MNMLYPVESHTGGFYRPTPHTVAMFFDYGSAVDFIHADERTLFLGDPRYDRRQKGYRFTPPQIGQSYKEWCAEQDLRRGIVRDLKFTAEMKKRRAA